MLNHFRTLLLNESYDGDATEHIPQDFQSLTLSKEFNDVHRILVPPATSRFYKLFLAHNYINIVRAAGLDREFEMFDKRITYSTDYSDFFKIYRYSNPAVSNTNHPIFIQGRYRGNETNNSFYDNYQITQIGSTLRILIYSTVREQYINAQQAFDTPEEEAEILVDFTANAVSKPIKIGSSGISFSLGGGDIFTSTSNKTWEFLVEAPFQFRFNDIFTALTNTPTEGLFAFNPKVEVENFKNLWTRHYNPIYRVAGLLLAYVTKLNSTL